MADQNWGVLSKSQTDDETIEEAIARMILAHEVDEESHLGAGESLQSHKASEIIDHLAGSIVSDKRTMKQFEVRSDFESLTGFYLFGDPMSFFPGVQLPIGDGIAECAKVCASNEMVLKQLVFDDESLLSFNLRIPDYEDGWNGWLGIGGSFSAYDDLIFPDGYGFEIANGVLYARVQRSGGNSRSIISGIDFEVLHNFRCQYTPADGKCHYFVDGVEVLSLSLPSGTTSEQNPFVSFIIKRIDCGEILMNVSNLFYSFNIA